MTHAIYQNPYFELEKHRPLHGRKRNNSASRVRTLRAESFQSFDQEKGTTMEVFWLQAAATLCVLGVVSPVRLISETWYEVRSSSFRTTGVTEQVPIVAPAECSVRSGKRKQTSRLLRFALYVASYFQTLNVVSFATHFAFSDVHGAPHVCRT